AQLLRDVLPGGRLALLDRARAASPAQPLDRRRRPRRRTRNGPLPCRLVLAGLRRAAARDRADVQRLRFRRQGAGTPPCAVAEHRAGGRSAQAQRGTAQWGWCVSSQTAATATETTTIRSGTYVRRRRR